MKNIRLFVDILIELNIIFMYRCGGIELQFDDEIKYIEQDCTLEEFINIIHEWLNTK